LPKILWINPVGTADYDQALREWIDAAKHPKTQVDVVSLDRGPKHLEYHYYEALILADVLHLVKRAEKEGYDAAIPGCFYDPGLREAREITNQIIVTAPAEASMLIAATLGDRFSIVVGRKKWIPKMHENVVNCGLKERLASFESVDLGVEDFQKDKEETERRLAEAAKRAIENELAEVIILGCGYQFGFYKVLQKKLGVPVIDAVVAALKHAEMGIELQKRLGWGHSKRYEYKSPPAEEIEAWELSDQYPGMKGLWY
jgi:allantoin racemase